MPTQQELLFFQAQYNASLSVLSNQLNSELGYITEPFERIRRIIYLGAQIIHIRMLMCSPNLSIEYNPSHIISKYYTLAEIINTDPSMLLNNEKLFVNFASLAYDYDFALLEACIISGARLSYNSIFMTLFKQLQQDPQQQYRAQLLQTFVMDNNSPPQPWHNYQAQEQEVARQAAAEKARLAEIARREKEAQEAARLVELARKEREAEERLAEIARIENELKKLKDAEDARQAEIVRKEKEAEELRLAEIARKEKEAQEAEVARLAEIARLFKEAEIAKFKIIENYNIEACNKNLANTDKCEQMLHDIGCYFSTINNQKPKAIHNQAIDFIKNLNLTLKQTLSMLEQSLNQSFYKNQFLEKLMDYPLADFHNANNNSAILSLAGELLSKDKTQDQQLKAKLKVHAKKAEEHCAPPVLVAVTPPAVPSPKVNKVETPAVVVKSPKEQKIRVLNPKEQAQEAMKALDWEAINILIKKDKKLSGYVKENIIDKLKDCKEDVFVKFLQNVELIDENLVELAGHLTQQQTVFAVIQRIIKFSDARYYFYAIQVKFENVVKKFAAVPDEKLPEHPLYQAVSDKNHAANIWATDATLPLYTRIVEAQPGQSVSLAPLPYLVNSFNMARKTPLMLAFAKGLSKSTILSMIKESFDSIYLVDDTGQNVFHYWARSVLANNKESLAKAKDLIDPLWTKFKEQALKTGHVLDKVNQKTIIDGDTFLHVLIKANSPEVALELLRALYSIDSTLQFASAILLKNNPATTEGGKLIPGKTVIDLVEEREIFDADTLKLLYEKIVEVSFSLCLQYWTDFQKYFPNNQLFFNYERGNNIIGRLLEQRNLKRMVQIIELRNNFRTALKMQEAEVKRSPQFKPMLKAIEQIAARLEKFFGVNEYRMLLSNLYSPENVVAQLVVRDHVSLVGELNEHLLTNPDPELELMCNSFIFKQTEDVIELPDSLAWKSLKRHLSGQSPMSDKIYKLCLKPIRARVNLMYAPDSKAALDYAMEANNLPLVRVLHTECGAIINNDIACSAILNSHKVKDFAIADYIYEHSPLKYDANARLVSSLGLYDQSAIVLGNPQLIKWLNQHDFSMLGVLPEDKLNVMQRLIIMATDLNIEIILAVMRALLAKKSEVKQLFAHSAKEPRDYRTMNFIFETACGQRLNAENIRRLFELCLQNGGSIVNIGVTRGRNALHNVLALNDYKLMGLCFAHTSDTDIRQMLTTKDDTGYSIQEAIKDPKATQVITQELMQVIIDKLVSLGLEQPAAKPEKVEVSNGNGALRNTFSM